MKTSPIQAAALAFPDAGAPQPLLVKDKGLPACWQGRERFVLLETGFGGGHHFLATWQAWRDDPQRCERLVFIGIEMRPPRRSDLARAHATAPDADLARQLIDAWPPLTPNLHALEFEGGRVRLLLALGDLRDWLKELVAEVDAFCLDASIGDPYTLKLLARLARPGASVAAHSWTPTLQDGLRAAGFEVGGPTMMRFAPRHAMQKPAGRMPLASDAREALVIGAGLAGAACARALVRQGLKVQVLDAAEGPARGASGNPMGLFHGSLHGADGVHARFNRAAALALNNALPALTSLQRGLLRLEMDLPLAQMQERLRAQALPPEYVQALGAEAASALAGMQLANPAWLFPGGGALAPFELVQQWLADIPARYGQSMAGLRREGGQWQVLDDRGVLLAQSPLLVLATGHASAALLADHALPIEVERGQLSHLPSPGPRVPLAGSGYAIDDGAGGLWCGATRALNDPDPQLRSADHESNVAQWSVLSGQAFDAPLAGRVGWRLLAPDRLPLVGGLPAPGFEGRADQPRFIPRLPGLVVCTALASRGITWALLCGEIAAALATGAPCPVEADLLDAVDPARYLVRQRRRNPA